MANKKKAKKTKPEVEVAPVVEEAPAPVVKPEATPAPAIADEPMCYSRSGGGQSKHMTVAEHQARGKKGK